MVLPAWVSSPLRPNYGGLTDAVRFGGSISLPIQIVRFHVCFGDEWTSGESKSKLDTYSEYNYGIPLRSSRVIATPIGL